MVPNWFYMNDQAGPHFSVEAAKTYFLRVINMSGYSQFYLHIDGHNFTIIEADGVYMLPQSVKDLYIATGQRYGVLLRTKLTKKIRTTQFWVPLMSMVTTLSQYQQISIPMLLEHWCMIVCNMHSARMFYYFPNTTVSY